MAEPFSDDRRETLSREIDRLVRQGVRIAHVGIYDLFGTFRERRFELTEVMDLCEKDGTFVNVLPQWDAAENVFGPGPFVGERIQIDPGSIRCYPFEPDACMMVADYTGDSSSLSPRYLARQQIARAEALGFGVNLAFESEFIILDEDQSSLRESAFSTLDAFAEDNRCWSGESAATHAGFVSELEQILLAGDIRPQSLSLELGPGCFEVTLRHGEGLRAAEDMLALKMFVKAFCRQRGMTASFMAQLGAEFPGLSQHPHISLVDRASGKNLFGSSESGAPNPLMGQFIAGMLAMMPGAIALTHHNVNAYKRMAPGNWAPKTASWACQNYSTAIRAVVNPSQRARIEYRLPGADANPYLSLAFILGAGLWGIENKLKLPTASSGGSPSDDGASAESSDTRLPHDLYSALAAMTSSSDVNTIWGNDFVTHFVAALGNEEAALRREVSAAERARYLEVL